MIFDFADGGVALGALSRASFPKSSVRLATAGVRDSISQPAKLFPGFQDEYAGRTLRFESSNFDAAHAARMAASIVPDAA